MDSIVLLLLVAVGGLVLGIVLAFAFLPRLDPVAAAATASATAGHLERIEQLQAQAALAMPAEVGRVRESLIEEMGRLREGFITQHSQQRQEFTAQFGAQQQASAQQAAAAAELVRKSFEGFALQSQQLIATMEARADALRNTVDERLKALQQGNESKLDAMRQTVDEKLQATLEARLSASFQLVSERLEQVHRGLGEMSTLAVGVGDLKRVLSNVKTRGIFGEIQLAALLEQLLTVDQYAANVATVPGSAERVEFAVRLPGRANEQPVWLPIDAKFPREDYERLLDAQERADVAGIEEAGKALENRVRHEAKQIKTKYIAPPYTTDFALMFLPTEGLYAEVLRRPGLVDTLQREQRVVVAGPTTLTALLNSLQMGFRTLAIEKRSSEVWQVLGAVKTEFAKFGVVLDKVGEKLDQARKQIDETGVRSRAMERRLRTVEELPAEDADRLLGLAAVKAVADEAGD